MTASSQDVQFQHSFILWVMQQQQKNQMNWQASQTKSATVSSVYSFWRLFNHIHPPSKLIHADYSFFKEGIEPAWEDPKCKGRWVAKLQGNQDDVWIQVLSGLVTWEFDTVCGAVFSARRGGVKLAIWTGSESEDEVLSIGKAFKKLLSEDIQLVYESFQNTGETLYKL
jgi:translation initiation factor 4E